MAADRGMHTARQSIRWLETAAVERIGPALAQWWANPLLRHARRQAPLPLRRVRTGIVTGALVSAALSILAWAAGSRALGAALIGVSLGAVVSPALIAAPAGADRIARQMHFSRQDPRRLADPDPQEIAWGLALVSLWRLRWLIIAGLALTPALMIGVLRLDMADYAIWQSSRDVLGETAAQGSLMLRADGAIPYFRLVVRALSAGITPWVALPLAASLGVLAAMALRDLTLSPLAALVSEVPVVLIVGGLWNLITRTPALAGGLEIVRLLLIIALCGGLWIAARGVNHLNMAQLVAARRTINAIGPADNEDSDEGS